MANDDKTRNKLRESARGAGRMGLSKVTSTRGGLPGLRRLRRRIRRAWWRLLERPVVWVVLLLSVGVWGLTPGGLLPVPAAQEGEVATRDYVAPSDLLIPDEDTTAEKEVRAREDVPPVYDFDPGASSEAARKIALLFSEGRRRTAEVAGAAPSAPAPRGALTEALAEASGLRLTVEQVSALATTGFPSELEERAILLASRILRRGIVEGKARLLENRVRGITLRNLASGAERRDFDLYDYFEYPGEVREFLDAEVGDWRDLGANQRRQVVELLIANLPPNLSPNRSATLERQETAMTAVAPTFKQVRKGQVIVRKGDQIGLAEARIIAEITGRNRLAGRLFPVIGTIALLGLAALALWLGLGRERVADHSRQRLYSEALFLLLISILGTKFWFLLSTALAQSFEAAPFNAFRSYAYGVPFAGLALVAALLFGRPAALMLSFLFAMLISRLAGSEALWATVYATIGSLGAVFAVESFQVKQRLMLTRVGLLVGGLNVLSVLIVTTLYAGSSLDPLRLGFDLVCAFVGGLLVAAVGSFSLPILEAVLGITTDIKLVELANTNLPLLRQLAFDAPGTFQHSLMVANLSKEGCEAIGADPVLAYTGGLYHDVGKMLRPEYFVENQRPGQNRHDKLVPSMSALIIISHVKDGLDLADQHHLPQVIHDAIAQHHGTRLISYFYNRAKERAEREEDVREEKYRYPGPKPQNKTMGVLMIADGVEAASRTLVDPTPMTIRTLVRKIVDDCLADGQLDESDLTLSDIRRVSRSFERLLTTIFHHRIDYPGFDFGGDTRDSTRAERASGVAAASAGQKARAS